MAANLYNMDSPQQIIIVTVTVCAPFLQCTFDREWLIWLHVASVSCLPSCAQSFVLLSVLSGSFFGGRGEFSHSLSLLLCLCRTLPPLTAIVVPVLSHSSKSYLTGLLRDSLTFGNYPVCDLSHHPPSCCLVHLFLAQVLLTLYTQL